MTDLGEVSYMLGMSVKRDRVRRRLMVSQDLYLRNMLEKFGMGECKPIGTPLDTNVSFEPLHDNEDVHEKERYQSAIGSLLYASMGTRPDISQAVGALSQFVSRPGVQHWRGVQRVFRYLKGTLGHGLLYSGNGKLVGWSDADWAGERSTRKSTSGFVFTIGGGAVSWSSKRQPVVALSTTEAEYMALCEACKERMWLVQMLSDLGLSAFDSGVLFEDNQGAIALAKNPVEHQRMKHIDIRFHFIREKVVNQEVEIVYCPTTEMVADMLTKPLPLKKFKDMCKGVGVVGEG